MEVFIRLGHEEVAGLFGEDHEPFAKMLDEPIAGFTAPLLGEWPVTEDKDDMAGIAGMKDAVAGFDVLA